MSQNSLYRPIMRTDSSISPRLLRALPGVLLFAIFTVIYFVFRTNHLTEDSVGYAYRAVTSTGRTFHPHHLLYNALLKIVLFVLGERPGELERQLLILQSLNIIVSSLAVAVLYAIARVLGASLAVAIAFAAIFGLSDAFFRYSSQIEVYNITSLFLALAVLGLVLPRNDRRSDWLVGSGFFAGMCFHQTALFFGAAIAAGELLSFREASLGGRLTRRLVLPLFAIGAAYMLVGVHHGRIGIGPVLHWMTTYAHSGYWGHGDLSLQNAGDAVVTFFRTFSDFGGGSIVPSIGFAAAILALLGSRFLARAVSTRPRWRLITAMVTWIAFQAAFNMWWLSTNPEFWIVTTLPALVILMAVVCRANDPRVSSRNETREPRRQAVTITALVVCLVSLIVPMPEHAEKNREPNLLREAGLVCKNIVRDGDHVFAVSSAQLSYYRLFTNRERVTVEHINGQIAREAVDRSTPETFTQALFDLFRERVREVRQSGGKCYIDAWVERGELSTIRNMVHVDPRAFHAALHSAFVLTPIYGNRTDPFFEVHPRNEDVIDPHRN